jgi:hypothetical protein
LTLPDPDSCQTNFYGPCDVVVSWPGNVASGNVGVEIASGLPRDVIVNVFGSPVHVSINLTDADGSLLWSWSGDLQPIC